MTTNDPSDELAELLSAAARLAGEAALAAQTGDVETALRLSEEADGLRRRAMARARAEGRIPGPTRTRSSVTEAGDMVGSRGPASSARELTVAALSELGVPSSPRSIADYISARFGLEVDPRALAALRRDEQRSWSSPRTQRAVYVVPALEGRRFLPMRGKVALSAWPLEDRLIGPWSERLNHLKATISVARQARWLADSKHDRAGATLALMTRYAATIGAADPTNPSSVEEAASAELEAMSDDDRAWRQDAGAQARAILDERAELWGARAPAAVRVG